MLSWLPNALSLDILEMIIAELTVRDKKNLLMLNKEWNAFMEGNVQVWKQLDFGTLAPSRLKLMHGSRRSEAGVIFDLTPLIRFYGTKAKSGIYQLRVHGFLCCDWTSLLSHNWRHLSDLEINTIGGETDSLRHLAKNLPDLKKLNIGGFFATDIAVWFLETCLKLEHARFDVRGEKSGEILCSGRISPRLQSLDINFSINDVPDEQRNFLKDVISSAFNLEDLTMQNADGHTIPDVRHLTKLRRLDMLGCHCSNLLLPADLELLSMCFDDLSETSIITPLTKLTNLFIDYTYSGIDLDTFCKMYEAIGSELNTLTIMLSEIEDEIDVYTTLIRCIGNSGQISKVRTLELHTVADDLLLEVIATTFPKLESLEILGNDCLVSRDGMMVFVKSLPKLTSIDLGLGRELQSEVEMWLENSHNLAIPDSEA